MATKSTSVKATLKITSFIIRLLMNIMFYILVIFLIVAISRKAFQFAYQLYGPVRVEEAPGKDIIFQIKKGESSMDVASKLERNRVIVNKYSFYVKTKLQGAEIMQGRESRPKRIRQGHKNRSKRIRQEYENKERQI